MNVYVTLKELGLQLPQAPAKGGVYSPSKRFGGNLVYISGCGPVLSEPVTGKLGQEFDVEGAKVHARNAMLNVLAVLEREIGDLNRVKSCVKLLVFVAGTNEFYQQPAVANGASELLAAMFNDVPTRSAIGVNALPGNIPVEVEGIFEIED